MNTPRTVQTDTPSLREIREWASQVLVLLDTATGIANTGAIALEDDDPDIRGCFRGIAHLLRAATTQVSMIEESLHELPREESCP
jgi:hypothetical protein